MRQVLDQAEVEFFSKYIISTSDDKSVYDLVPCDSETERKFVQNLEVGHGALPYTDARVTRSRAGWTHGIVSAYDSRSGSWDRPRIGDRERVL